MVWYKRELKKDASWQPKDMLVEDIGDEDLNELVKEYNNSLKKKK